MEERALLAFLVALALTAAVTPVVARLARRIGAVDPVTERGLARERTPLLGGMAILAGVLVAGAIFLPASSEMRGILGAAALITAVGIADDIRDLSPPVKLLGQAAAGLICVLSGVRVDDFTFPFLGRVDLGDFGGPLTLLHGTCWSPPWRRIAVSTSWKQRIFTATPAEGLGECPQAGVACREKFRPSGRAK